MAIVVKHEGNAGAYAAGAYEGGRGKRRAQGAVLIGLKPAHF